MDATRDDSGGHMDATGNDGDEQVDATGDDRDKLNATGIHILSQPPLPLHSNNSVSLSQKHSHCWGLYAGHDFHVWYRTVDVRTMAWSIFSLKVQGADLFLSHEISSFLHHSFANDK